MSAAIAWVGLVGGLIGCLAGLVAILAYGQNKKDAAMAEGRRRAEIEQLRKDIEAVECRVDRIEDKMGASDVDLAEIKTDLRHVLADIAKLFDKIDELGKARP